MFLVNMDDGKIVQDEEIKKLITSKRPYKKWIDELPEGAKIEIFASISGENGSNAQLAKIHAMIREVANDLGNTWKDISGFGPISSGVSVSSKGFPNVAVHSLIVMPNDPNIIWAGTDIGLVETRDRGNNWHLVESNLPHVAIMDMKLKDSSQWYRSTERCAPFFWLQTHCS